MNNTASNFDTEVQFMHYRADNFNRGATVAILPLSKEKAIVSISRCGPNDVFCKKTGRQIASGRLRAFLAGRNKLESKVFEVEIDYDNIKDSVNAQIGEELANEGLY